MSSSVRARIRKPGRKRRLFVRERLIDSLWFIPTVMSVVAFAVAVALVTADRRLELVPPGWFPAGDVGSATALTSVVGATSLTFMVTLFSTTLIAIQLAGGQYSPRIVRIFTHSRLTQVTLGIFLASFIVDVAALVAIRSDTERFVPEFTVGLAFLLLFATLVAFITFLSRMTRLLRVQYLMRVVLMSGVRALDDSWPTVDVGVDAVVPETADDPTTALIQVEGTGVLQAIDHGRLAALAAKRDCWIELLVRTGDYLDAGRPLARIHGGSGIAAAEISAAFLRGQERTFADDPAFAIRLLADIALRALSPAVNDPTTATQAVDRIVDLIGRMGVRPEPTGWYADPAGVARLHVAEPSLAELCSLAFAEIIHYGAGAPQVVGRLQRAFAELSPRLPGHVHPVLDQLSDTLARCAASGLAAPIAEWVADGAGTGAQRPD